METPCHNCAAVGLELASGFERFHRVTSDCKPWPPGGRLACCPRCRLVQTPVTPEWRAECRRIYEGYTIYHQSGGTEQSVFPSGTGQASARSQAILEAVRTHCSLPDTGRLLDIGCGNGSFLRVASASLPGWRFVGTEFDAKYRDAVEAIARVDRLHTGPLAELPEEFDAVTLIHVLEHIAGPTAMLREILGRLKPGGLLVVEVPDCTQNPFMLLVADHCSHFGPAGLGAIAASAGFEVLHATNQWISKEITVVGRRPAAGRPTLPASDAHPQPVEADRILGGTETLGRVLEQARGLANTKGFGIFGTSIAATWLQTELGGAARFFVDEDPGRQGREHLGRAIVAPADVAPGSCVLVALPPGLAARVAARLRRPGVEYLVPAP